MHKLCQGFVSRNGTPRRGEFGHLGLAAQEGIATSKGPSKQGPQQKRRPLEIQRRRRFSSPEVGDAKPPAGPVSMNRAAGTSPKWVRRSERGRSQNQTGPLRSEAGQCPAAGTGATQFFKAGHYLSWGKHSGTKRLYWTVGLIQDASSTMCSSSITAQLPSSLHTTRYSAPP